MTNRNAECAVESAGIKVVVNGHIAEGNQALKRMVTTIEGIESSGCKIASIIRVIDGIARLTNIPALNAALNAAVEAARAGDAGLRFAVVADEVRSLALRSARAAKDTAGPVEESMAVSRGGCATVQKVDSAMRSITASVAQVRVLVEAVKHGSQEQALGVEEISREKWIGQPSHLLQPPKNPPPPDTS